jgi:hypothetical protein
MMLSCKLVGVLLSVNRSQLIALQVHGFDGHQPQNRGSVDRASNKGRKNEGRMSEHREGVDEVQPVMLENGKYNCNHKCKDKSTSASLA